MAKLIAINTIHGSAEKLHKDGDGKPVYDRKGRPLRTLKEVVVAPGEEFDPAEFGMDDEEVAALVAAGAAREPSAIAAKAKRTAAPPPTSPPPAGGGIENDVMPSQEELEAMSRAELDALAADWEIDVSKAKNKADVIALLLEPDA